jgi:hypothetical protein
MTERQPPISHFGVVVNDLERATSLLSAAFGMAWSPTQTADGELMGPRGPGRRASVGTLSLEPAQQIELIEHIDDTFWRASGALPPCHLGVCVSDLPSELTRLQELGLSLQYHGFDDEGQVSRFAYLHDAASGLWIELVDTAHFEQSRQR